jgi:hypothetical protein
VGQHAFPFRLAVCTLTAALLSRCTGLSLSGIAWLVHSMATFLPWFRLDDVVYNGYLTSFSYSPVRLCPDSLHPYVPGNCLMWLAPNDRLRRFGDCCDTFFTFRAVLGLMLFGFLGSLLGIGVLVFATWKRNDPRHINAVRAVGFLFLLCGLTGALSILIFFVTRSIYEPHWDYVTILPSSSHAVSAGPVLAAITAVLFAVAGTSLACWHRCTYTKICRRVR